MEKENIHRTGFNTGIGIIAVLLVLTLVNGCSMTNEVSRDSGIFSKIYDSISAKDYLALLNLSQEEGIKVDASQSTYSTMSGVKSSNAHEADIWDLRDTEGIWHHFTISTYEMYKPASCNESFSNFTEYFDDGYRKYETVFEIVTFCKCKYNVNLLYFSNAKIDHHQVILDLKDKIEGRIKCH